MTGPVAPKKGRSGSQQEMSIENHSRMGVSAFPRFSTILEIFLNGIIRTKFQPYIVISNSCQFLIFIEEERGPIRSKLRDKRLTPKFRLTWVSVNT